MNGRMRLWSILKYYPNLLLEGLGKITNVFSQDHHLSGLESGPGTPDNEVGVVTDTRKIWLMSWEGSGSKRL
jgi:hypothetical protein